MLGALHKENVEVVELALGRETKSMMEIGVVWSKLSRASAVCCVLTQLALQLTPLFTLSQEDIPYLEKRQASLTTEQQKKLLQLSISQKETSDHIKTLQK